MKLAALCSILAAIAATAAAQDTATVEGVVVNKVTGAGIEGATVWLWSSSTNSSKAVTNGAGIFNFTGLAPGDYSSSVQKSGYSGPETQELVPPRDAPKQHIAAGAQPVHLRFELIPPAVLRGRVLDADGNPARASIELGPRWTIPTNADGSFVAANLAPGSYTLLARPTVTRHGSAKDAPRTEPVPTYYPSTQDRSLAETIVVRAGAELSGYDIRLQSAEVHRVRGMVLNPDGKPSAKAEVTLQSKRERLTEPFNMKGIVDGRVAYSFQRIAATGPSDEEPVITGDDGVFEFPSVRAGEWTVQVHSDWVRDEGQNRNLLRFGSAAFRVDHEDVDGLKIVFATPFPLSLRTAVVLSDGSAPPAGVSLAVNMMSEAGGTITRVEAQTGGNLEFKQVLPGGHRLQAEVLAGNYYADSILLGSTDITGQTVELTPASPPLKIILKPAGTLRGTLEGAESATVLLIPPSFTGTGYSVQSNGKTMELTGIVPGEYAAIALDGRLEAPSMTDPARLRGLMPQSTSVRLEPGSTAFVQLKVKHVIE